MNYKIKWLLILFAGALFACNKYNPHNTDTHIGISTVTHYVVLTLKGESFQSVVENGSYTDSGVTAVENGADVDYSVSGSIDFTTPGVYVLTYTAVNKDGYPSSITRRVAVIPSPALPDVDLSGTYDNLGTASLTATITKVAPGVYYTTNCWGGSSQAVIPAYFFCPDGASIEIYYQNNPDYGHLDGTGTYSAGKIAWTITLEDQAFTADKAWQKQ